MKALMDEAVTQGDVDSRRGDDNARDQILAGPSIKKRKVQNVDDFVRSSMGN